MKDKYTKKYKQIVNEQVNESVIGNLLQKLNIFGNSDDKSPNWGGMGKPNYARKEYWQGRLNINPERVNRGDVVVDEDNVQWLVLSNLISTEETRKSHERHLPEEYRRFYDPYGFIYSIMIYSPTWSIPTDKHYDSTNITLKPLVPLLKNANKLIANYTSRSHDEVNMFFPERAVNALKQF